MKKLLLMSLTIFILFGCNRDKAPQMNRDQVGKVASKVAQNFIEQKENRKFVVTDIQFPDNSDANVIFVDGYYKGNKNEKVEVMVEQGEEENDFKVAGIGKNK